MPEISFLDVIRQRIFESINENPKTREDLERHHGQVWNTIELEKDFETLTFDAPFVFVRRRSDGVPGILLYQEKGALSFDFNAIQIMESPGIS